ncbi:unnamed protein product [Bursaphelenchus xylophilus]|uniref:(pine wood nematode) hypothetical protein n=1 Tax=Bursaphelenchus xylophilus TaxID=6326 RepID=A0A811M097_BURXY|nr:unnamed protein product [Bursaphelenchus xylophilus]CAG9126107.1 unnamed protein product [Bursaphelenchus xylophilus]
MRGAANVHALYESAGRRIIIKIASPHPELLWVHLVERNTKQTPDTCTHTELPRGQFAPRGHHLNAFGSDVPSPLAGVFTASN